jgi:Flp pilus assembly secretin CpaC|tara:strand:+ start:156 stop:737 length:582 start_codon:yes stop_codon:yes gene_type:complete
MGKKKKGGKKKGGGDEGEVGDKEKLRLLFAENQSLKRQLADRRNDAMSAISGKKELEARVADLKRDFEREEKATFSITADMTRQYKDMQEDLIKRINEAENTITELKDQLELQGLAYEDLKKEKDRALAIKEAEIVDMKQKMDDMSAEFGDMLKATLEKMSERINITNSNFDADLSSNGVPTEDKMQEFSMKK